jgi:hypothetical protein
MTQADPNSVHSSLREQIIEHLFVGDVLRYLWCCGAHEIEVLHSAIDGHGYDLVMSLGQVTRHVQLKSLSTNGRNTRFNVRNTLVAKESACLIVIVVDPASLTLGPYLWFGGNPRQPLPDISKYPVATHTKGNSEGVKTERPYYRVVPKKNLRLLSSIADVVEALFGTLPRTRLIAENTAPLASNRATLTAVD